jgi:hypothetical protein
VELPGAAEWEGSFAKALDSLGRDRRALQASLHRMHRMGGEGEQDHGS